jgi:hypothetical protein
MILDLRFLLIKILPTYTDFDIDMASQFLSTENIFSVIYVQCISQRISKNKYCSVFNDTLYESDIEQGLIKAFEALKIY